jgi:hypothetical protein
VVFRAASVWAVLAATILGADADSAALLAKVRGKVKENVARLPNFTCVQQIERSRFQEVPPRWRSCGDLAEASLHPGRPARELVSKNWLRLDVTVASKSEIFTWAGGEHFETGDIDALVGDGLSGSGDFGSFSGNIFFESGVEFVYRGERVEGGRKLAQFTYRVPAAASHYQIKIAGGVRKTLAFGGEFWADAERGDLMRLTVDIVDPPWESEVCSAGSEMEYQRVRIGGADFMLPEVTRLHMLSSGGSEARNETRYRACHQFLGESTLRFDDPAASAESSVKKEPVKIPAGAVLKIALSAGIDSATAAAGDPVEGTLVQPVLDEGRNAIFRAGAVLHGRIMRLEQRFWPEREFFLGLRFDTLEVDRVRQPISLQFSTGQNGWKDGVQYSLPSRGGKMELLPLETRPYVGTFRLKEKDRFRLDRRFVTEWKTVAQASVVR